MNVSKYTCVVSISSLIGLKKKTKNKQVHVFNLDRNIGRRRDAEVSAYDGLIKTDRARCNFVRYERFRVNLSF